MARKPIDEYRLSPAAQSDLDGIWDYTAETWSPAQAESYVRGIAETFAMLLRHPEIAREYTEIDPPVRLHPHRSHLIVYRIEADCLAVIRILHTRQHWQSLLGG